MSSTAEIIEEAYQLTKNAFVRYIIEDSEPDVRDDFDRRALALLEDWARECRYSQMALGDYLSDMNVVPASSSFPIDYTQFNYLSPGFLLQPLLEKSAAETAQLAELAKSLGGSARAQDLLSAVIARQKYYVERAQKLEAEQVHEAPRAAKIKGTSASRW